MFTFFSRGFGVNRIFQKHQHRLKTISCFIHGEGMVDTLSETILNNS